MLEVSKKWNKSYPDSMKNWEKNWDILSPTFKFSPEVRKVIYTTNAIESLNSTYRRLNKQRTVFPSDISLLKALYLATQTAEKKWCYPIRNWEKVYEELSVIYSERIPEWKKINRKNKHFLKSRLTYQKIELYLKHSSIRKIINLF